jgi:NACHT domain
MRWGRLRAERWLAVAVLVAAAGFVLLIAGVTAKALGAADLPLVRSANQVTVLGGALTVAGLACSAGRRAWARLQGTAVAVPSWEMLRVQVAAREQEIRSALLAGLVPVNLAWASDASAGPASLSRREGALGTLQRAVGGLLRYTVTGMRPGGPPVPAAAPGDLRSVRGLFAGLENGRLVILGQPGAGKTVLAIELVLQLLQDQASDPVQAAGKRVPVRLGAATWVPGQDLGQWIAQRLVLDYRIPAAAAAQLAAGHHVLPVLDGLDEMDPDPLSHAGPTRALALLRELNAHGHLGCPAPVVVTCRAGRYEQIQAAGPALQADQVITIGDLDTACVADYLHARYSADRSMLAAWDEVLGSLGEPAGAAARLVLSTPWRLLLAVTAAEDGKDPRQLLTAKPGEDPAAAGQRIVQELLASYIPAATRLASRRGRRAARYQPGQAERWLRVIAGHLAWQAAWAADHPDAPTGMTGIDIVPHLLWPIGGRRLVRAIHTALGFLGAAAVAVIVSYTAIGPPQAWAATVSFFFHGDYGFTARFGQVLGALLLTVGYPAAAAAFSGTRWPEPNLSMRAARIRHFDWSGLAFGLAFGLVGGLAGGTAVGLVVGLAAGIAPGIAVGLAFGLAGALAAGIAGGLGWMFGSWMPDATMVSPMRAVRQMLIIGLAAGLAGWLVVGIAGWLAFGIAAGLIVGLAGGLAVGTRAAVSWVRYTLGHACAVSRRRLPAHLGHFLSWAQDSGLLRVSGATYQFRHRELQDWLTAPLPLAKASRAARQRVCPPRIMRGLSVRLWHQSRTP